jgi:hypothetical protein
MTACLMSMNTIEATLYTEITYGVEWPIPRIYVICKIKEFILDEKCCFFTKFRSVFDKLF